MVSSVQLNVSVADKRAIARRAALVESSSGGTKRS